MYYIFLYAAVVFVVSGKNEWMNDWMNELLEVVIKWKI